MPNSRKLSNEERRKYLSLRRSFKKPVIGVTGFLGKTTTIDMISAVLETRGKVLKNSKGFGTWKSNIQTLEKLTPEYDYAVFEFDYQRGNHFAEILRLIKPTIGIVTNIGDAHLNYLGNMMQIALERSAVVKYLARDGVAILNKDDELSSALSDFIINKKVIKFGLSQNSDYFATDIKQLGPQGIEFRLNGSIDIRLPIYSIQDMYNFLAALACVETLGFARDTAIEVFKSRFSLSQGKGKLQKAGDIYLLDESYLANPRSLSKAARSLIGFRPYSEHLYFIVGDMSEAGLRVEEQHLNMGYFLSALPIPNLITVGEYARFIAKGAALIDANQKQIHAVNTVDEVLQVLEEQLADKAVISIKGLGNVATHRIRKYIEERFGTSFK